MSCLVCGPGGCHCGAAVIDEQIERLVREKVRMMETSSPRLIIPKQPQGTMEGPVSFAMPKPSPTMERMGEMLEAAQRRAFEAVAASTSDMLMRNEFEQLHVPCEDGELRLRIGRTTDTVLVADRNPNGAPTQWCDIDRLGAMAVRKLLKRVVALEEELGEARCRAIDLAAQLGEMEERTAARDLMEVRLPLLDSDD